MAFRVFTRRRRPRVILSARDRRQESVRAARPFLAHQARSARASVSLAPFIDASSPLSRRHEQPCRATSIRASQGRRNSPGAGCQRVLRRQGLGGRPDHRRLRLGEIAAGSRYEATFADNRPEINAGSSLYLFEAIKMFSTTMGSADSRLRPERYQLPSFHKCKTVNRVRRFSFTSKGSIKFFSKKSEI